MRISKKLALSLLLTTWIHLYATIDIANGLKTLPETPYGFCIVPVDLTPDELDDFNKIAIHTTDGLTQFGAFIKLEHNIKNFLHRVTTNDTDLIERVAHTIARIAHTVMEVSQETTGWFLLRTSLPTDAYNIARWHMDGHYFTPTTRTSMMYKFIMTFVGSPTLFYKLPKDNNRVAIWKKTMDRPYMDTFCTQDLVVTAKKGEGVFFISGNIHESALHSEPPIHENRLFFSIVPCNNQQIIELKKKVLRTETETIS